MRRYSISNRHFLEFTKIPPHSESEEDDEQYVEGMEDAIEGMCEDDAGDSPEVLAGLSELLRLRKYPPLKLGSSNLKVRAQDLPKRIPTIQIISTFQTILKFCWISRKF
jgi:hypothetical protein